ncbi:HD domain-containing protein [Desulfatirhabdium butyrativorans]|uniref:HD domain-containing protein n=1 Tax=Desulfatirhabdium butyrativorans TaxID=340467 RepID=UPI000407D577|nr:HD domain-containing protein [Desulfatirhabdium butyrativorans]
MRSIADFLFEARFLKEIPRSGFAFLGAGKESVAEHVYLTTVIAYVLSMREPHIDLRRLLLLCLFHDLPEARLGDLNSVQKPYHHPDTAACIEGVSEGLPFAEALRDFLVSFEGGLGKEAILARDADQLSLIVELKWLNDHGASEASKWIDGVMARLKTGAAKELAQQILDTQSDAWWWNICRKSSPTER